jgi:hypothetical protein
MPMIGEGGKRRPPIARKNVALSKRGCAKGRKRFDNDLEEEECVGGGKGRVEERGGLRRVKEKKLVEV